MRPILIPKDFDMARLIESNDLGLIDVDFLNLYVQNGIGEVPGNHGLGIMSEAEECIVTQEINGEFDLEMKYPVCGHVFSSIEIGCVIMATSDRSGHLQPFRIYRITKSIDGHISIYAHHLAYDLAGIIAKPFNASNVERAVAALSTNSMSNNLFVFSTNKTEEIPFSTRIPTPIWTLMGKDEGGLLETYNGEWVFDGYGVRLVNKRGQNREEVVVRYGFNMTEFEHDADFSEVYSGIVAYWESDREGVIYTPVVSSQGGLEYTKVKVVDMSSMLDYKPLPSELLSLAKDYATYNEISKLVPSWKINFVPIDMTEEYKSTSKLYMVDLGDTISVIFEQMNINATARVNAIEWNVLRDRYESLSLDNVKNTLADTIAGLDMKNKRGSSALNRKVDKVPGKGLSTNDYTNADKSKLDTVATGATNVQQSQVNGFVNINGTDTPVYTLPNDVIQADIVPIGKGGTGSNVVWQDVSVTYNTTGIVSNHNIIVKYSPYLGICMLRGSATITGPTTKNTAYEVATIDDHLPTAITPVTVSLTSGGHANLRSTDGVMRLYSHSDLPTGTYYIYFSAWWFV